MSEKRRVAIVNYGMGNLFSVEQACLVVGLAPIVTSSPQDVLDSEGVIVPGVGAFGDAMAALERTGMVNPLKEIALKRCKPLMGICLGLQLMMEESFEFGYHKGLGLIHGSVIRFDQSIKDQTGRAVKVPQVGWNRIFQLKSRELGTKPWAESLLQGVEEGEFMYFVHSFYVVPKEKEVQLSMTRYGDTEFCSAIERDQIFGCQFHPERSGAQGLRIYQNFAKRVSQSVTVPK